jgi:hypothetical protein
MTMLKTQQRVDIAIDPDTVRMFADKAKAMNSGIDRSEEDGNQHDIEFDADRISDRHHHDGLAEEEAEDYTEEELLELIADLNDDEAQALVALVWVGRGDYEASEWEEALVQARERAEGPTAKYLMRMPLLADYLENGLDVLNL